MGAGVAVAVGWGVWGGGGGGVLLGLGVVVGGGTAAVGAMGVARNPHESRKIASRVKGRERRINLSA